MLTTWDNPFSPFKQFDQWLSYDRGMGYYSLEYLGRIAHTSSSLSDSQNEEIVDDAINEIVSYDVLGRYRKVYEKDFEST